VQRPRFSQKQSKMIEVKSKSRNKKTAIAKFDLPAVYLTDWYYTKVKYPLQGKGSYYDETEDSYVYVMYNEINKLYKIGITSQIERRRANISTQSGCKIEMVLFIQLHTGYDEKARDIERLLHEFFANRRVMGEWFRLDVRCLIAINSLFWEIEGEYIQDNIRNHLKIAEK
jgi:hypothetical protein